PDIVPLPPLPLRPLSPREPRPHSRLIHRIGFRPRWPQGSPAAGPLFGFQAFAARLRRCGMPLSDEQLERCARHIVLREVGGAGQAKLLAARVLVIGAGGLGSPVIVYLAAAGVGTIGIVDFDAVSLSNL